MNVILNISSIDWQPLISIPEEHQAVFTRWVDTQTQVSNLRGKQYHFGTPECQQEYLDLALAASDLVAECKRVVFLLIESFGWFDESNYQWALLFRMEENDPFQDSIYNRKDNRPVVPLKDYHPTKFVKRDCTVTDLITELRNLPPNWTLDNQIKIHGYRGGFNIFTK